MSDVARVEWPRNRSAPLAWLVNESAGERFVESVFAQLCNRLLAEGLPLDRATMQLRTLHPQFMGARMLWRPGLDEAEVRFLNFDFVDNAAFINSPIRALWEGADGIRKRLDLKLENQPDEYGIYTDLRAEGFTDYVALAMQFTDGRRHASTWATKRPGGFTTADLVAIDDLLPVLAMTAEIRLNRRIARTLLNTYVGEHAGSRILAGDIRRGSGSTVRAAIWNSDLRGFTQISETWPRDDVISWLNEYFDVMAGPVQENGGEILKFIGDGMLAVFPLEGEGACFRALNAALQARKGMLALNERRREQGTFELGFGLALHVGDVMYGNVGTKERLDFTVIGPAVNVAARLQEVAKILKRQLVISAPFAYLCGCSADFLAPLGAFPLRGVGEPLEVFGITAERSA
ncbi:MAG: adenylate/guanylate cyclase domain-containing protein [Geminicoccaceae bacterium]